jgi:beta-phosphoglucomutase-like phosphatase (HAD superfamily)
MHASIQPATWSAIFDWDGVIIDSSSHHEESWERLARETGRALPAGHFKKGFGRKNEFIIPEILEWTREAAEIERFSLRKEALYREVVAERGVEALPGVRLWLERLHEARVPCVIGSSTHRANIELSLDLLGLGDSFAAMSAPKMSRAASRTHRSFSPRQKRSRGRRSAVWCSKTRSWGSKRRMRAA